MPGLGQGEDLPAVWQAGLRPNLTLLLLLIVFLEFPHNRIIVQAVSNDMPNAVHLR